MKTTEYKYIVKAFSMYDKGAVLYSSVEHGEHDSESSILAKIFDQCNNGSGKESEDFINSKFRSLSVGDEVHLEINNTTRRFNCDPFGWTLIQD